MSYRYTLFRYYYDEVQVQYDVGFWFLYYLSILTNNCRGMCESSIIQSQKYFGGNYCTVVEKDNTQVLLKYMSSSLTDILRFYHTCPAYSTVLITCKCA